jgi:two-component system, NarL family, response regulator NreC
MMLGVAKDAGRRYSQTVLVADDSPVVRSGLADVINSTPGMVISGLAVSAGSAIDLAGSFQPDVALIDMNMPGGGIEAATGIHVACPQTRMLAFSVRRDKDAVLAMLHAGASGYLLKGTRPARIVSGILQVTRGRAVLSPELGRFIIQGLVVDQELSSMLGESPVRVMAVDDDLAVVEAVGELISEEAGLQLVGTATNVDDATTVAASAQPDVALVDVRMPEWGGERVAFELARVSPRTRILAFSASDDPDEVVTMLRGGAAGYIVKGFGSQELTNNIRSCARGHTVLEIGADALRALTSWPRPGPSGTWTVA